MARAMLDDSGTPDTFWGEAAHTMVNILNKAHVHVNSDKTPYELWYGNPPTVKHFRVFGSKCFIKNNDEKHGKFEPRADEEYFLVTPLGVEHINVTIKDFGRLLNVLMLLLMSLLQLQKKKKKQ